MNRYELYIFLYKDRKLLQRGGHRRRARYPIEKQASIETPEQLILTTKGEGKLRYTLSWRPQNQETSAQGIAISQEYPKNKELVLSFQLEKPGSVWIFDQLPSAVKPIINKTEWMQDFDLSGNDLWIKTKELKAGTYSLHIPIKIRHNGSYHDPPVRIAMDGIWLGQSSSSTLEFNE